VTLRVGSLFSGAAGMSRGFEQAGFETAWFAEVDKDASSVLRRHYPGVPNHGDVTQIHGGKIEPVDVIEGGSPCQDVSQAGARAGLAGARSGLFFEYVRIVREMREKTEGRYPAVAVLENVDGLLSSHSGRDFAVVLSRLQDLGAAVAWRVLDAQLHGVPQRRRRVFLVADFAPVGAGERRAAQILALGESLCRHPQAGDEEGQVLAAALEAGAGVGSALYAISPWLARNSQSPNQFGIKYDEQSDCLDTTGYQSVAYGEPIVYQCHGTNVGPLGTIRAGNGHVTGGVPFVVEPVAAAVSVPLTANYGNQNGQDAFTGCLIAASVASTLAASAGHHGHSSPRGDGSDNLIAFHLTQDPISSESAVPAFSAGSSNGCASMGVLQALQDSQSDTRIGDCLGTLDANYGPRRRLGVFEVAGLRWIVRRLTPVEGERLMGWPDSWTRWRDDGSEISDSARWRLIGNGVVTPVARFIAERIYAALDDQP
jgi:DNA (cytosine-5)-methyltransferase 1